jgi:hypothetical protein
MGRTSSVGDQSAHRTVSTYRVEAERGIEPRTYALRARPRPVVHTPNDVRFETNTDGAPLKIRLRAAVRLPGA